MTFPATDPHVWQQQMLLLQIENKALTGPSDTRKLLVFQVI
ncbi:MULTISPECIES: hypothetical protein [Bradyrhizobium]|nr:hypothetical protein [Bradyrhizobium zhengyangense]